MLWNCNYLCLGPCSVPPPLLGLGVHCPEHYMAVSATTEHIEQNETVSTLHSDIYLLCPSGSSTHTSLSLSLSHLTHSLAHALCRKASITGTNIYIRPVPATSVCVK